VAIILDVQTVGFEEKYLGLPVPEGRMKNGKFQPVKEKINVETQHTTACVVCKSLT
jgi:hypothetical protein